MTNGGPYLQQIDGTAHIVCVVFQRILTRIADRFQSSQMNNAVDAMLSVWDAINVDVPSPTSLSKYLPEDGLQRADLFDVDVVERQRSSGQLLDSLQTLGFLTRPVCQKQIVHDNDTGDEILAEQLDEGVSSDVTGSARHQNVDFGGAT